MPADAVDVLNAADVGEDQPSPPGSYATVENLVGNTAISSAMSGCGLFQG